MERVVPFFVGIFMRKGDLPVGDPTQLRNSIPTK